MGKSKHVASRGFLATARLSCFEITCQNSRKYSSIFREMRLSPTAIYRTRAIHATCRRWGNSVTSSRRWRHRRATPATGWRHWAASTNRSGSWMHGAGSRAPTCWWRHVVRCSQPDVVMVTSSCGMLPSLNRVNCKFVVISPDNV